MKLVKREMIDAEADTVKPGKDETARTDAIGREHEKFTEREGQLLGL